MYLLNMGLTKYHLSPAESATPFSEPEGNVRSSSSSDVGMDAYGKADVCSDAPRESSVPVNDEGLGKRRKYARGIISGNTYKFHQYLTSTMLKDFTEDRPTPN
jgi:hypothetical protein